MQIAVEHLSRWPIAVTTEYATADVVLEIMETDNIHVSAPPRTVVSDNVIRLQPMHSSTK